MSNIKQLITVLEVERRKEENLGNQYRLAAQAVEENKQKLHGLEEYRLTYLKQLQNKGESGLEAKNLNQHHAFVAKLDRACEQQTQFLSRASLVAEQRKTAWLKQQRQRKAIEQLIDKKQVALRLQQDKQEQQMFDEFALQQFSRKASI